MKKILAMILAAVMLLGVCSAYAENSGKTMVEYDEKLTFAFAVPEGYNFQSEVIDGIMLGSMISEQENMPNYLVVIGQDEEHEELPRLNDLDEAAKQQMMLDLAEDMNNPACEIQTTGLGTEVIVINEHDAEYDLAVLTTLYYGCVITMYVGHNDGSEVTEADLATAMQIMTDLDFVVAE